MKIFPTNQRASGILAHISSLPSPFGIGDIGPSSYSFLEFLNNSAQSYWQFLPVGPTNPIFDNSPYMSTSAFAGSPLLISPDLLFRQNLINRRQLEGHPEFSPYLTDYPEVISYKQRVLRTAFSNFSSKENEGYAAFVENTFWLNDYALYMTLKEKYDHAGWNRWPARFAAHDPEVLDQIFRREKDTVDYYRFEQYEFFRQWIELRRRAGQLNIRLFGDLPIYVGFDSVDVWANQGNFTLDRTNLEPTAVAGVPPDYFSPTGQRWGNPLYSWSSKNFETQEHLLEWWTQRFAAAFSMADLIRIDHFRGFESYWSIPADEKTAVNGRWKKGPGKAFFDKIFSVLGRLNIVAEDLGEITPAVIRLKNSLGFPGMKILQFAFDNNPENSFLPYNFESSNCIVYTGTHDNDTTVGWFLSDKIGEEDRKRIKLFANREQNDSRGVHQDIIHLALSSTAFLSILPLQDVLGFGSDCRMNTPSTCEGNWRWRCAPDFLTPEVSSWLREKTMLYGRGPKERKEKSAESE